MAATSGEATGLTAAYEYLCLAYVVADRYTSSEEHRRVQYNYVMVMAEEAATGLAASTGSDKLEGLNRLERHLMVPQVMGADRRLVDDLTASTGS